MDRLREASVAVYEVPAEEAEERLHAAQRIDELVQETARSIRLSKAALRFSPRSVAAPSKHFPLATLRTSLAASRARSEDFGVAWSRALGTQSWMKAEVDWPGDTVTRRLWREAIEATEPDWRAAYYGEPPPPGSSPRTSRRCSTRPLFGTPQPRAPVPLGEGVTIRPPIRGSGRGSVSAGSGRRMTARLGLCGSTRT